MLLTNLINQFFHIYFWVFIVACIVEFVNDNTEGVNKNTGLLTVIGWV